MYSVRQDVPCLNIVLICSRDFPKTRNHFMTWQESHFLCRDAVNMRVETALPGVTLQLWWRNPCTHCPLSIYFKFPWYWDRRFSGILRRIEATFLPKFRDNQSVPRAAWLLNVGQIGCRETSSKNYHSVLCNIPEDSIYHFHRRRSLKFSAVLLKTVKLFS